MASTFEQLVADASIEGYWPLTDDAASTVVVDSSGNSRNGTLAGGNNTADLSVAGPGFGFDKGLHLDGSAYVSLPTSAIIGGSQDRTVAMWIWPDVSHSGYLFGSGNDVASGQGWRFFYSSGALRIELNFGGYTSSLTPTVGAWNFVACRLSGTTLAGHSLYLGGSKVNATGTLAVNTGSTYARIGNRDDTFGALPFDGSIAGVGWWSRALTDEEIGIYMAGPLAAGSTLLLRRRNFARRAS